VESTSRRTGLQLGLAAVTEANRGDFSVKLKRDRDRASTKSFPTFANKVNDEYPQLDVEFIQVLQDMIGDLTSSPEPIEIKLFSPTPALLKMGAEDWRENQEDQRRRRREGRHRKHHQRPGHRDEGGSGGGGARSGFTPQEIELDASAILQGEPATTPVVVNDRSYTIRVRFPETRASLDQIRNTMITSSSTGKTATLGSLATFRDEAGQTEIAARICSAMSR
jgi:multidrug efflux pump subunit AcrB